MLKFGFQIYDDMEKNKMKWLNPNSQLLQYIVYNFNKINTIKSYRLYD